MQSGLVPVIFLILAVACRSIRILSKTGQNIAGSVECRGIKGYNQTCLLHNAFYDPESTNLSVFALDGQQLLAEENLKLFLSGVPNEHPVNVNVKRFANDAAMQTFIHNTAAWKVPGLSVAMQAVWHHNWAHGIFDSLYPAYVGLAKFGLHDEAYTPFIRFDESVCPGDRHVESVQMTNMGCWVEDAWGRFGALGMPNKDIIQMSTVPTWMQFDKLVVGSAAGGEYTANTELPGLHLLPGESLLRKFADRMYSAHGFDPQPKRSNSRDGRPPVLKVRIADVEHFSAQDRVVHQQAAMEMHPFGPKNASMQLVRLDSVVKSSDVTAVNEAVRQLKQNHILDVDAEVIHWEQIQPFWKQLQLMYDVDIFVTGPGTGQFYSVFLPDGAVQISLGARYVDPDGLGTFPSFREEMIPGSNTHIKASFMDLNKVARGYTALDVIELVHTAASQIRQGFAIPIANPTDNLSPLGKIVSELMMQSPSSTRGLTGFGRWDSGYQCHQRPTGQTSVADIVFELLSMPTRTDLMVECDIDVKLLRNLKRKYGLDRMFGRPSTCDCVICPSCGPIIQ